MPTSKRTPWGTAISETEYASGITFYSTPGHGGFKLDRKRNAMVPDYLRRPGGWYEEDCETAIVALVFPEVRARLSGGEEYVRRIMQDYYPDEYARFTCQPVAIEDSYVLQQRAFDAAHADDWVVLAAWGDWHARVPKGMVGVYATKGGRNPDAEPRYFLVPKAEYDKRKGFGFVVDPSRHEQVDPLQ